LGADSKFASSEFASKWPFPWFLGHASNAILPKRDTGDSFRRIALAAMRVGPESFLIDSSGSSGGTAAQWAEENAASAETPAGPAG